MSATDLEETSHHTRSRATSRTGTCVTSRSGSSFMIQPFGFVAKTSYDATESLLKSRSDSYLIKPPPKDYNIWRRPPPDFRPQCYAPSPPKRNSREAMQPWKYGTIPGEKPQRRHTAPVRLPHLMTSQGEEDGKFVTMFSIPGSWEGKLLSAKDGTYRPGPYHMPKPHDFRGYPPIQSLGLPEFETEYERDPYNLKFHSEHLDILPGDGPAVREQREIKGQQMAPPLPIPPDWEARLILPQEPFPNKSYCYTRYRRLGRTPYSALMERVGENLDVQWARDKLDQQILKQSSKHKEHQPKTHETEETLTIANSTEDDNDF